MSPAYVNRALSGQRKGEVYCWEHHKQGKTVYIHYHSLKAEYRETIKDVFCGGAEPELWIRQQDEQKVQATFESLTDQITSLVTSDPAEIRELTESKLFTPTEIHQIARAAGWLRLINEINVKRARKAGFNSINDFRSQAFKRCLNEQTTNPPLVKFKKGLITNERTLVKNAVDYRQQGIKALIHAGVGNVNREKADTLTHAKLLELASAPVKYSWEDVALIYNTWAVSNGKTELTTSTVKQYLNIPKIKKVWFYARHGKLAADNVIQPLINRDKPSFPDALWSLDGTTMQLYYRDADGKIKSDLYTYFVTDANSGAVIGHSIAFAETSGMVDAALRNAITIHGYKPYQMQYDNSSANVSVAVRNLMSNMSRVHFPCEPYKGRSKYVEGIIGHFQQRVLRYFEHFKGGNITATSLNSKANPELLAKFKKNPELLPTQDQIIADFELAIRSWNNRGEKRDNYGRFVGPSKIDKYTNTPHELRQKVNYFDRISLFMVEQRELYTYGAEGIKIEIDGLKHKFIVPDPDTVGDFIFSNENFGRKFTVKLDRDTPELVALYRGGVFIDFAYNKEKYAACVADMKQNPGSNAKRVMFKAKQEIWGQQHSLKELEKQMNILGELKATGTDGLGWWDSPKIVTNSREAVLEDVANGIDDGLTDRQRRILKIGK
ncbi:MAG: hypothetical protein A2W92_06150 [Bacteroidetes bacterium GWA2_42_15]|nr:MAG: hypothetical protein A2W92_06150 [Bacteroidetes bacterium GWA2_42_15]